MKVLQQVFRMILIKSFDQSQYLFKPCLNLSKTKKPFNLLKGLSLLCGLVAIRTQDLLLRRQLLYPAELRNHNLLFYYLRKVNKKSKKKLINQFENLKTKFQITELTN